MNFTYNEAVAMSKLDVQGLSASGTITEEQERILGKLVQSFKSFTHQQEASND